MPNNLEWLPHDGKREPVADGNVAPRNMRTICTGLSVGIDIHFSSLFVQHVHVHGHTSGRARKKAGT
jgi:hypothetical protein